MSLIVKNIETDRLRLVPISKTYREDIFREFTEEITTFMNPKPAETIEDTDEWIEQSERKIKNGEELVYVILKKETGEYLGNAGVHNLKMPHPELGVWIKKSAHGKRYGREAVAGIKQFLDEEKWMYEYLIYPVDKRNIASRKIAESLGGIVKEEKKVKNQSGNELDEVIYHIIQ